MRVFLTIANKVSRIHKGLLLVWAILIIFTFLIGGEIGWNWGHEEGLKESKASIEKSLELYNLGELKYMELAKETASGKESNPELVQKLWDIKARQDVLLNDVWEFAKKLGIETKIENFPLKER